MLGSVGGRRPLAGVVPPELLLGQGGIEGCVESSVALNVTRVGGGGQ